MTGATLTTSPSKKATLRPEFLPCKVTNESIELYEELVIRDHYAGRGGCHMYERGAWSRGNVSFAFNNYDHAVELVLRMADKLREPTWPALTAAMFNAYLADCSSNELPFHRDGTFSDYQYPGGIAVINISGKGTLECIHAEESLQFDYRRVHNGDYNNLVSDHLYFNMAQGDVVRLSNGAQEDGWLHGGNFNNTGRVSLVLRYWGD